MHRPELVGKLALILVVCPSRADFDRIPSVVYADRSPSPYGKKIRINPKTIVRNSLPSDSSGTAVAAILPDDLDPGKFAQI